MNYPANTTRWQPGDLVIHEADAKTVDMLRQVIGYTPEGLCRTVYLNSRRWGRAVYEDEIGVLHDPAQFEIDTKPFTEV